VLLIAIKAMLHVTINSSQNIAPSIGLRRWWWVLGLCPRYRRFIWLQVGTTGSRAKEMTGIRRNGFPLAASGKITQILLETHVIWRGRLKFAHNCHNAVQING
jgi:hypothetical protein